MTENGRSYALPKTLQHWPSAPPVRPALPFLQPPSCVSLPTLPSPSREPSFSHAYTLSTHTVPAAYPRYAPHVAPPSLPANFDTLHKHGRGAVLDDVVTELMKLRYAYEAHKPVGEASKDPLWIAVNRYTRKEPLKEGGLTLVLAHAIGFCKEACYIFTL
jgi:hypothetical protein